MAKLPFENSPLDLNEKMDPTIELDYEEYLNEAHGDKFIVELEGDFPGMQGLSGDSFIEDYDIVEDALRFEDVIGGTLSDLDSNIESVVDSGYGTTFNFIGGGSLTLSGISGYQDFTSLSMDYIVEVSE